MEEVDKKWKVFLSEDSTKSAPLKHLQMYQSIKSECDVAYASWKKKYDTYQQVLESSEDKKQTSNISSERLSSLSLEKASHEYTQLQNEFNNKVDQCQSEQDIHSLFQLYKKLDMMHTIIQAHLNM